MDTANKIRLRKAIKYRIRKSLRQYWSNTIDDLYFKMATKNEPH
jgi:hypothetical protein